VSDDSKVVITCEPYMDISDAVNIHKELQNALDSGQEVEIKASEVERIDTSVLQLFYGFIKEAQTRGIAIKWKEVSEPVKTSATNLGITKHLGIP